jgi:arylsulfatase A-like enzyme
MKRSVTISLVALVTISLATITILFCFPWGTKARGARLVLLYATCTVNKDYLAPYNSEVDFTPFLADFAPQGVVFTKHHTEAGQSGVAFASLFSGYHAMGHGIFFHPTRLSEDIHLLAEEFRSNGYETFFWADHPMASPDLNFAQGIDESNVYWTTRDPYSPHRIERFLKGADPRFQRILDDLRADPEYKAFIQTNFTVTHYPYSDEHVDRFCKRYPRRCKELTAAEIQRYRRLLTENTFGWRYASEATKDKLGLSDEESKKLNRVGEILYQSNVFYLDELFGAVVDRIQAAGLLDESLITFTADHGEVLHRDNATYKWTHGFQLAPEVIQAPLILHAPNLEPGRYDSVTRSVDVFPTLAALAGAPMGDRKMLGVDLSAAVHGEVPAPRLLAFSHTALAPANHYERDASHPLRRRFPQRHPRLAWVAVRDRDMVYKLTSEDGRVFHPSVYDWRADRDERTNLYDPANESHRVMIQRLNRYKAKLVEGYSYWQAAAPDQLPSDRKEELLRSLGYIE